MTLSRSLFPTNAFVGFDKLFDELDAIASRATDTYPPHSILKVTDNEYLIEIAVAGFSEDDITITAEDRVLSVSGRKGEDKREYLHKGISTKRFERKFRLGEGVEVVDAKLENGILAIELKVVVPSKIA